MGSELKSEIEDAAALLGTTVTAFATQTLVERAREVKHAYSQTLLNAQARNAFMELMDNPPAPSDALIDTMSVRSVTI